MAMERLGAAGMTNEIDWKLSPHSVMSVEKLS